MFEDVPPELVAVVERHGRVVAANDQEAILADFRPDRIGQLVASASLPPDLASSELLRLEPEPDGLFAAFIRYTSADGRRTVLRSRWIHLPQGWRVTQVRNLPATPPSMPAGPSPDGLDAPHWEGLRVGELRIQRCARCTEWIWAPRPICPACHSFSLGWPAVAAEGRVFSWTRTWQPFAPAFSGHLPFVVLLVELPAAGGRRVLGVLLDADGLDPAVGLAVRGEIDASASSPSASSPPVSSLPVSTSESAGGWPVLRWRLV